MSTLKVMVIWLEHETIIAIKTITRNVLHFISGIKVR
jgi:hypothetical protein